MSTKDPIDPREVRPVDPIHFTRHLVEHLIPILERQGLIRETEVEKIELISHEMQFAILVALRDEGIRTGHETQNLSEAIDELVKNVWATRGTGRVPGLRLSIVHPGGEDD